ncbi:aminopeptidase O isoform X6 [Canis lupus baileyi]|uniref:aminopeptidase O isoform X5 n=1 Tax=Canis lupus familiaris TaxID=9615 RepID=UPI000DC6A2C6|nr:aminopeptidase O isoform X5 [Canis lupus familiaris]XP_038510899.1 aminopeptidase O isoform X5 [Canis lupus familiaris]XP_048971853.1 aminopeptidase O isoform X6 [Canis lupus dingo]
MDVKLEPSWDDLPLMANTSHILVKHYVLDLDVDFESQIFEGTIVLFFESRNRLEKQSGSTKETCRSESNEACRFSTPEPCHSPVTDTRTSSSKTGYNDFAICGKGEKDTSGKDGNHDNPEQASGISSSKYCCDTGNHGSEDFLLVLDCCDLSVFKVEEVDVAAVPGIETFTGSPQITFVSEELRNQIVHELVTLPADRWREQFDYYAHCSQAPGCGELLFDTDTWSLQIRKTGAQTATDFPHAIRIWYSTKPQGRSVTWTSDQSGRPCVYTMGSPVNNRALFPCQEPPVAMSTWQATVGAAASFVVLMSGENSAKPTQLREGRASWHYYVTMPMPASTFTIAVGSWAEMKPEICSSEDLAAERSLTPSEADFSPHIIFLSQSVLIGMNHLCGTRLCHEIAHAWFGLAIGARDWTEEWLSEGFATHLEDVFWAKAQQLAPHEAWEQQELKADLRWRCLQDEVRNYPEEMQVLSCLSETPSLGPRNTVIAMTTEAPSPLQPSVWNMQSDRPNKEKTGHVSDSGSSVIKHGLNPEKVFMQVHYLKGYFLLRFLAQRLGDDTYFAFLRKFVHTFHGQLILSQDFLQMLLENIPEEKRLDLSVENIFRDWLESSGIPQPLQTERQARAECGLARRVGAEVHKWIRVNRRPHKRKRRETEEVFEKNLSPSLRLERRTQSSPSLTSDQVLQETSTAPSRPACLASGASLRAEDSEPPNSAKPQEDIPALPTGCRDRLKKPTICCLLDSRSFLKVRHRWCELIVKHKYTKAYKDVERFLQEDQERSQRDSFPCMCTQPWWDRGRVDAGRQRKGNGAAEASSIHTTVLLFPRLPSPGLMERVVPLCRPGLTASGHGVRIGSPSWGEGTSVTGDESHLRYIGKAAVHFAYGCSGYF